MTATSNLFCRSLVANQLLSWVHDQDSDFWHKVWDIITHGSGVNPIDPLQRDEEVSCRQRIVKEALDLLPAGDKALFQAFKERTVEGATLDMRRWIHCAVASFILSWHGRIEVGEVEFWWAPVQKACDAVSRQVLSNLLFRQARVGARPV